MYSALIKYSQETAVNNVEDNDIQSLLRFRKLLTPVRLSIVMILYQNRRISVGELRRFLGIPWGTLSSNIELLENEKVIETHREFLDESPRVMIYLTKFGRDMVEQVRQNLKSLLNL